MTVEEVIEYLMQFPKCAKVYIAAVNIKKRTEYIVDNAEFIDVDGQPNLCIDIGGEEPFNQKAREIAEECERAADD